MNELLIPATYVADLFTALSVSCTVTPSLSRRSRFPNYSYVVGSKS